MFYATRRRVYWRLTHNLVFGWYSNLISHARTHARTHAHTHTHKDKAHYYDMMSSHFLTSHLWDNPPIHTHRHTCTDYSSILKLPLEIPVHDHWKVQNCQVAEKCIDTTLINKYFVNKFTTLSLYHKSFINNNIVNKIQCMYWFNYKLVTGLQRKTSKC